MNNRSIFATLASALLLTGSLAASTNTASQTQSQAQTQAREGTRAAHDHGPRGERAGPRSEWPALSAEQQAEREQARAEREQERAEALQARVSELLAQGGDPRAVAWLQQAQTLLGGSEAERRAGHGLVHAAEGLLGLVPERPEGLRGRGGRGR